jgi:putative IMPACT (imprinted ancient) family translation regulator
MVDENTADEIQLRRNEEVEALLSYYGEDDFKRNLKEFNSLSSPDTASEQPMHSCSNTPSALPLPLDGPWFLRLRLNNENIVEHNTQNSRNRYNDATLELRLPSDYPLGSTPPTPILHMQNSNMHNGISASIDSNKKRQFLQELQDNYIEGTCVGIYWGECCREFLLKIIPSSSSSSILLRQAEMESEKEHAGEEVPSVDALVINDDIHKDTGVADKNTTITFLPSTTRFHQPIRYFPSSIITNPHYQCTIHRTPPFHPPNSGASECLIAHVAKVQCKEHVLWTLGQLLLYDKKVSKASHNMFAYRFYTKSSSSEDADGAVGSSDGERSNGRALLVSDNDDDGEKGSGKKLSALLELCHAENVLVVVSRWFGGELLGAARFKWIASVAKDGLVQAGVV